MKITILDCATLGVDINISPICEISETETFPLTPREEIVNRLKESEVCVINKVKLDKEILAKLPRLKLICVAATGYDNVDSAYCKERGIALCNVPGYSSESVAQLTAAMVLSASVRLPEYRESTASGRYTKEGKPNILTPVWHELCGKSWGIVGYGGIGKRVGDIARALGCRIKVFKRIPEEGVECVSLEEIATECDIISIHLPCNQSTEGIISREIIASMKKDVILINAARGRVTDEDAIAEAIKEGRLGFFGCDVYSEEPFSESHPFYEIKNYPNVCLTPHMAWGAYETRNRCVDEMAKNIISFIAGEKRNRVV